MFTQFLSKDLLVDGKKKLNSVCDIHLLKKVREVSQDQLSRDCTFIYVTSSVSRVRNFFPFSAPSWVFFKHEHKLNSCLTLYPLWLTCIYFLLTISPLNRTLKSGE